LKPPKSALATILIVDDDAAIREYLGRLLSRDGYAVQHACNGEAAAALTEQSPPDLILLDIRLPGIDGFEVCRRLKHHPATRLTPVVLMTGGYDQGRKLTGIGAGADDFLRKPIDEEELRARVASLVRLKRYTDELESADAMMISLALTVEARDSCTQGHCDRLARYASAFGDRLQLPHEDIKTLSRGAYLHDLGKIAVPDAVLLKSSKLTPAEFAVMKEHAVIGERLCAPLRSLASVLPIIRHHHERWNGSGYPDALHGDAIPLLAQIVGIIDVYDAITTTRPYRAARVPQQAYEELTEAGLRGAHRIDLIKEFLAVVPSIACETESVELQSLWSA
jgi:putative two-component system response regulator